MAKKKIADRQDDVKEMFAAMQEIEKIKGIPVDVLLENIQRSIEKACKSYYNNEDVVFHVDAEAGVFEAFIRKTVVDDVTDPNREIDINEAREYDVRAGIGEKVRVPIDTKKLGRISVQNARSVIRQGIRDKEREITLDEFREKSREIVTALVENIDPETGNATIRIGRSIATLPKSEQVGISDLKEGDSVKVYIAEVRENDPTKKKSRGPRAVISRTSVDFVKRLFELEVPEISDGTVEIKAVAREAGSRTKIAVISHNPNVDCVGACIGTRGIRVARIVDELGGEKIDIIEYKEDKAEFIAAALSPANVVSVVFNGIVQENDETDGRDQKEGKEEWRVTVPDSQLSLAIGNRGQNARLAARLTGCKIDIRPESGNYGSDEDEAEEDIIAPDTDTADLNAEETAADIIAEDNDNDSEQIVELDEDGAAPQEADGAEEIPEE